MDCDIVLTVYNQLELTKRCIESVLKYFRNQDRLILVDNGSDPETTSYLKEVSTANKVFDIELIRFEPNQGFIKAANAGLGFSDKETVCLLSNDTVVTAGWLEEMLRLMEKEPDIGIVNPASSTFSLYPSRSQSIDELARSLDKFKGSYTNTAACFGFCMLIRREVIQKIGILDEVFGRGYFEDSDFCRRANTAGFRCVISKAAYVWHREHSTFKSQEIEKLFQRNKGIFEGRWGRPQRILCLLGKGKKRESLAEPYLALAKKGHWLWIVLPKNQKEGDVEKLKSYGNIKLFFIPRVFLFFYALFIIIKKRKKKIDKLYIYGDLPGLAGFVFKRLLSLPVEEISYEK